MKKETLFIVVGALIVAYVLYSILKRPDTTGKAGRADEAGGAGGIGGAGGVSGIGGTGGIGGAGGTASFTSMAELAAAVDRLAAGVKVPVFRTKSVVFTAA